MKKYSYLLVAAVALTVGAAKADVFFWDGEGSDGLWVTGQNWTGTPDNTAPGAGDTANIGNGDTVSINGLVSGNLPNGSTINLSGNSTLTDGGSGTVRLNLSTVNVSSGSTLTGNFWDLNGGTLSFEDGAIADMNFWEHKGDNTFNFNLSASGFTTLTPGTLFFGNDGGGVATMADATYNVNFAGYTGGAATYTLIDFSTANITDADLQLATYNPVNAAGYTSSLSFDEVTDSIQLNVQVVPEPSVVALMAMGFVALVYRRRNG